MNGSAGRSLDGLQILQSVLHEPLAFPDHLPGLPVVLPAFSLKGQHPVITGLLQDLQTLQEPDFALSQRYGRPTYNILDVNVDHPVGDGPQDF